VEEFMNSLNSVLIEGNLTRDPALSQTPKGTPVCSFGVASNRYFKMDSELQQEVSFFEIEAWAKQAEACNEHLSKGRGVRVVGRLKQDRWQDQEGNPRSKVKIVAEHVEFKPQFSGKKLSDSEQGRDSDSVAAEQEKELQEVF
jgi:single-strand DNA-binding protein